MNSKTSKPSTSCSRNRPKTRTKAFSRKCLPVCRKPWAFTEAATDALHCIPVLALKMLRVQEVSERQSAFEAQTPLRYPNCLQFKHSAIRKPKPAMPTTAPSNLLNFIRSRRTYLKRIDLKAGLLPSAERGASWKLLPALLAKNVSKFLCSNH